MSGGSSGVMDVANKIKLKRGGVEMHVFGKVLLCLIIVSVMTLAAAHLAIAEEKKVEVNTSYSIKQILASFTGQRVAVKTDAGEAIEGTVTSVGDHIVHISRLSGKDFYDAVVVIDRISSVVFRARGN